MFRKISSLVLTSLLLHIALVTPVAANTKEEKNARRTEKVKAGIANLGAGVAARVKLKLHDGTKLNGYVREAGDESFVVVDATDRCIDS